MATKNINAEKIQGNLAINSISATTYYNVPPSITGGTYSSGALTLNGQNSSIIITGFTNVDYIDFNTGSTVSNKSGRLFYDNVSESLVYNSNISTNVPIKIGQQLYTKIINNTGSLIPKGSAVTIQSSFNGIPEITLAVANAPGSNNQVAGLTSEDILNGSQGLILNQGLLSGVTVSYPIGSILYLSDTIPGGLINSTSSLDYNSRTNQIGYTVATGTTTGVIYVSINNEDINLSITDIQRNILEGNVISTGAFNYTGLTKISSTQFSVAPVLGWVVNNTNGFATNPNVILVDYSGITSTTTPYLSSADQTYVLVSSASTLTLQTTFPTPQERRKNIFLGVVLHPTRNEIQNINNKVDFDVSPISALRDLWTPLKLINQGVIVSANGANLSINSSAGVLWGNGIGWPTNQLNPNSISITPQSPVTFQYRTQLGPISGGTAPYTGDTIFIDPNNYDLNGVVTAVGGGSNSSTNQRVYLYPNEDIVIQYGQQVYVNLTAAVAGSQTEQFVEYPNNRDNAILIGIISVQKSVTTLNSSSNAVFNFVSKFGEVLGGTGGLSTTTLQQAYDNSSNPEIVTNATQNGVQFRGGTGDDNDKNIIIENNAGIQTAWITASGDSKFNSLSATSVYTNYIDFNTAYVPTQQEGRLHWDVDYGTLDVDLEGNNINLKVGLDNLYYIKNQSGTTIDKGRVVRASGTLGASGRLLGEYMIADGTIPHYFTLGIAGENILNGEDGYVYEFGLIRGFDTTGSLYGETWVDGTILYVSSTIPGGLTSTEPTEPNLKIQMAIVVNADANGSVFVRPSLGYNLNDLHNLQTSGQTSGDLISYNSSQGYWEYTKTLTGNYTINGGLTSQSFTISTQTQDNSLNNFLVLNSNGDFYTRSYSSINYTPNLVTVALSGGSSNFNSIKLAVDSITGASSTNPYVVRVGPGLFNEDPIIMKSYVVVVGDSSTNTIIQAKDSNQTLLYGADQSMIQDCQIQGCTGTGVSAIVYSSSTTPQLNAIFYVENVRFGANYTHVKNIGTGGGNSIIQCSNVKYGGYPFTLGFHATNDGSGVGRIQLRNVTSTNGGVITQPDLIFAKADKPNCAFIVNGCLLTKAVGAAAGTGFWVEDGGSLRLTGVNFQRWTTGIYAPQSGSSPSIDAIALNFENCTTDVNIVHSGATGKIQGTDSFLKTKININAPLYEVNTDPREIIVAKKGGDFSSIKSAVDYLAVSGNTSSTSRYVISVGPGEFYEDEIDLTNTPYVSIVGSNIQTTQILPNNVNQHLIKIGVNNEISFLSFANAPSGYAAIYCDDIGDFAQAHKCSFYDCDTNVWVVSSTQDTKFYGEYLDFNGTYEYGTRVDASNGFLALANIENYYNFPTGSNITYCNWASGSGATLSVFVGDNISNGVSGTTAFYIQNYAELNSSTVTIDGFTYGIRDPNIGGPIRFDVDNASLVNGEWDLYVESINTFGTFGGSSDHSKIFTNSSDIYWSFLDITDGELDITRKASVTFADGTHTDFTTLLFEGSNMGLMNGGPITIVSGLTVSTGAGFGYLAKSLTPNVIMRIDWSESQITLGPNENKYIYFNENSILSASGTKPSSVSNIILGRVITNSTDVSFIDLSPVHSDHTSNRFGSLFREAMGPIYATGSIVTEGSPFTLDVTAGEYYYSSNMFQPIGGLGLTFTQYYRDGSGGWVTTATTVVTNSYYDGNGILSALTSGYYTKHTLYLVGDDIYENYFLVLGQNEYSSLIQTENALLPTPPTFFGDAVTQVANIYVQQGFSGITQIEDIRPTIAFRAGGVNASSVHGNLLGLSADDHTQYLLVNGGRSMAGNLNMDGNSIVSAGTINNVTIQSHATRHQFGGSDPVGSITPGPNYIPYADVNGKLDSWVSALPTKANTVAGTSFTGNPKKYTVTFITPYPNTNYSISISANINRTFTWETKTVNGFTINANSNTSFTENVDWITTKFGES
jgi:hypothetical protein